MIPSAEDINALTVAPTYVLLAIIIIALIVLIVMFFKRETASDEADKIERTQLIESLRKEQERAKAYNNTLDNLARALASAVDGFNKTASAIDRNTGVVEQNRLRIDDIYLTLTDETSKKSLGGLADQIAAVLERLDVLLLKIEYVEKALRTTGEQNEKADLSVS